MMEDELQQDKTPEQVPWTGGDVWKATLLAIVGTILAMGLLVLLLRLVVASGVEWVLDNWFLLIIAGIPLYAAMVLAVWFFSIRKYGCRWQNLGFRPTDRRGLLLGFAVLMVGITISVVYNIFIQQLGQEAPSSLPAEFIGTWYSWAILGVFAVIVAPLAEETFFRGFMLQGVARRFGVGWGVFISALLFALAHLQPGALVPIFLLGLMLAWLFYKTKSIWPCIAVHFAYNSIALVLMILSY